MSLNTKIVESMKTGFAHRRSVPSLAKEIGENPQDLLSQLMMLHDHGFALRWSDGRWSLSKRGEELRVVLVAPVPRTNGRKSSV